MFHVLIKRFNIATVSCAVTARLQTVWLLLCFVYHGCTLHLCST